MSSPLVPPQQPNPLIPPGMQPLPPALQAALDPPPSPSLGFQTWASDARNAHKVQPSMTAADAPLQPNAGQPMASLTPPPTKMQQALTPPGGFNANTGLSTPAPSLPSANPTVVPAGPASFTQDQAANPGKYAKPSVRSNKTAILNMLVAGLAGAAGGLKGDPTAGLKYAQDVQAHDEAVPGQNQALYQSSVVQPYQNTLQQGAEQLKNQAQLADIQSQTDERKANAQLRQQRADATEPVVVSPEQAKDMGFPGLAGETMDPKHIAVLMQGKQKADTATSIQNMKDQVAQMKPKQRDDQYIAIMSKPASARTDEDNAFVQGYKAMINTKVTQPGVAKAAAFGNNRVVQTVDPNTDNVVYQHAGDAINSGAAAPSSAAYKSDSALLKDFTSGSAAKNLTAFNTASGHLQTLGEAAKALHNGDIQGVNRIANEYAKQTGQPAPQNFQAVKQAVAGEVSKTFKGGQATDAEIKEFNDAISSASSPAQLYGVISTYQDLMDSKRQALMDQYNQGMQHKPNFGNAAKPPAKSGAAKDPLGIR